MGHQVRDCLHPRDVAALVVKQLHAERDASRPQIVNVSGGSDSARSLRQLSRWCEARWGPLPVGTDPVQRPFDLPWVVLDSGLALATWDWKPQISVEEILAEIATFAESNPTWISLCQ